MMDFHQLLQDLEINTSEVLERFSGNENLLERFMCKFPAEKTFQELNAAYHNQQLDELERTAHTLKGIAANLGFEALHASCAALVDDLRTTQAHLPEEFERISSEYTRLVTLIQTYSAQRT